MIAALESERGDSNARPLRPERSALPTALLSVCGCKVSASYENYKIKTIFFTSDSSIFVRHTTITHIL